MSICDSYGYAAFYGKQCRPLDEWYDLDKKDRTWVRRKVAEAIRYSLEREGTFNLKAWGEDFIDHANGTKELWYRRLYGYPDEIIRAEIDYWAAKAYLRYSKKLDCDTEDVVVSTEEEELKDWVYIAPFTKAVLKKECELSISEGWRFDPPTDKQLGYLIGLCKQGKLPYGWKRYKDIPFLDKGDVSTLIEMANSEEEPESWPDFNDRQQAVGATIIFSEDEYYEWRKEYAGY